VIHAALPLVFASMSADAGVILFRMRSPSPARLVTLLAAVVVPGGLVALAVWNLVRWLRGRPRASQPPVMDGQPTSSPPADVRLNP
jgi:hypothetical protein